jgi:hypothetical protein
MIAISPKPRLLARLLRLLGPPPPPPRRYFAAYWWSEAPRPVRKKERSLFFIQNGQWFP